MVPADLFQQLDESKKNFRTNHQASFLSLALEMGWERLA
jgi:hypothetical protein